MSHASVIVALSPEDIENAGGDIHAAVDHQMEPFDEEGEWFTEGSRWDWWVIGGRYTGKFEPEYSPYEDPANQEVCWLCQGSGLRNDELGRQARAKDPAYTCNGCSGSGKMVKHAPQWVDRGNICQRGDLDEATISQWMRNKAARIWAEWEKEPQKDEKFIREYKYGFAENETLETLTKRMESCYISAYAFLRNRRWYENERMGFFGLPAKSECTLKAEAKGEEYEGRCLHRDEASGAMIVTFEDEDGRWSQMYWPRFLRNLPPETTLVCVDYHV